MVELDSRRYWPIYALVMAALAIGIYARLKGLESAPLAVDEFFIVRSIENVLQYGVPQFDCGGYYTRGLILQYLAALLQLAGLSGEIAPRLICAVSSLLVLPAAYILGRRVHSRTVGLLAVIVLALSVWEVEMGRFARMYAPFQAVFLWYLVFFIRYAVDRDEKALWPMLGLTVLGPFVWEGGAFLALTNLLIPFLREPSGRLSKKDGLFLICMAALLGLAYWFVTADFRILDANAAWPPGYDRSQATWPGSALDEAQTPYAMLVDRPVWIALFLIVGIAALPAARWIWNWRTRPLALVGLAAALTAALLHQFLMVGAVLLLLLLLRTIQWNELFNRAAVPFHAALIASATFWLIFASITFDWGDPQVEGVLRKVAVFSYPFVSFPDFVAIVALPWAGAVPVLGLALTGLLATTASYLIIWRQQELSTDRVLLIVLVCLVLAASLGKPPRYETRYVFFLYPVALVLAITMIARGARALVASPRMAGSLAVLVTLTGFASTEDFNPGHLLHIDRRAEMFRADMSGAERSHLVSRADSRAVASWLKRNASSEDVVVNAFQSLDYYYAGIDYFFVDWRDFNLSAYACRRGTIDRWSNLPLLYNVEALEEQIGSSRRTFVVTYNDRVAKLLPRMAKWQPRVAWTTQNISIVAFEGK